MLFSRKDFLSGLVDIYEEIPYNLSLSYRGNTITTTIFKIINNTLILSEFTPLFFNDKIYPKMKIKLRFEYVDKFMFNVLIFDVKFLEAKPYEQFTGFYFKALNQPLKSQTKFKVIPTKKDNCTITFKINNIPQFKKVVKLTRNRIYFSGLLSHYKDYFGTLVYNIELKLPTKRIFVSGVFKELSEKLYCIEDYVLTKINLKAVFDYAMYNFLTTYKVHYQFGEEKAQVNNNYKKIEENQIDITNNREKILILNNNKTIAEIIVKYIKSKSSFDTVNIEDINNIIEIIANNKIKLIIVDYDFHKDEIDAIIPNLKKNNIPMLLLTKLNSYEIKNFLDKYEIKNYLKKPFDSNSLMNHLLKINNNNFKKDEMTINPDFMLIASDNKEFVKELEEYNKTKKYKYVTSYVAEEIFIKIRKYESTIVIVYFEKKIPILSIINTFRKTKELEHITLIIVLDKTSEISYVKMLESDNIICFENISSSKDFISKFEKIL